MKIKLAVAVLIALLFLTFPFPIVHAGTDVKIDSEETQSTYSDMGSSGVWDASSSACGSAFNQTKSVNYKLSVASWLCAKHSSPVGNLTARLYAITGTYGTNSTPTGVYLAESDKRAMADLPAAKAWFNFTFSGANMYTLVPNTQYFIQFVAIEKTTLDGSNHPHHYYDTNTSAHPGNSAFWGGASWTARTYDRTFIIYGQVATTETTKYGSASMSFTVGSTKSMSILKQTSVSLAFVVNGLKSIFRSIYEYGSSPLSFTVASSKTVSILKIMAVNLAFSVDGQKSFSILREMAVNLAFTVNNWRAWILNRLSSLNLGFTVNGERTGMFTLFGSSNLQFHFNIRTKTYGPSIVWPTITYVMICLAVLAIGLLTDRERKRRK